jgi:hypothetical protein
MCFMGTCFLAQVFFVVHAHAFSTCVSWALAFWYKCFLSSMHMLLVHVFHGHLLFFFCTSIFGRPSIHIYLYGEALFEEFIIGEEMQDV